MNRSTAVHIPGDEWWEAPPRVALLLITGIVLGPQFLDLLPGQTIDILAPVTPVALAAVGMFAVVHLRRRAVWETVPLLVPVVMLAIMGPALTDPEGLAVRGWRALQACGAAALVGGATAMLLTGATAIAGRVYLLAAILLLGGIASFVSAPALLAGVTGGLVIVFSAPSAAASMTPDLQYVTRPLATALLLLAGAGLEVSNVTFMLAAAWLLTILIARRGFGRSLVGPGVYALGAAVDAVQGVSDGLAPLISAAVMTTIVVQAWLFFLATDLSAPVPQKGEA